eukprot:608832-Amphidinium_carterae.1
MPAFLVLVPSSAVHLQFGSSATAIKLNPGVVSLRYHLQGEGLILHAQLEQMNSSVSEQAFKPCCDAASNLQVEVEQWCINLNTQFSAAVCFVKCCKIQPCQPKRSMGIRPYYASLSLPQ